MKGSATQPLPQLGRREKPGGFDPGRLRVLDAHLRRYVDDGRVAGLSWLIYHVDQTVQMRAVGMRDAAAAAPMTSDTIVRLYSLTKPVTAAATLALLEDGRLLLTDPVAKYLPEFGDMRVHVRNAQGADASEPAVREITILDLLRHTAGFGYGEDPAHPVDRMYRDTELFGGGRQTVAEMARKLAALPLKHQPGSRFEYSVAYDVLGAVVEAAAQTSFDVFLAQRLFEPLGMHDTAFHVPEAKLDRFAALYGPAADGSLTLLDAPRGSRYRQPVRFCAGGQGLVSTMQDYLRFLRMLFHGGTLDGVRCLSRKSVALMTCNHLPAALMKDLWMPGYGYGLGVGVLEDVAANGNPGSRGEYTWAGSASTYFWIDPAEALIAMLFMQFEPSSQLPIAREFKALMYQALN